MRAIEEALETTFPASYLSFITTHGPVFTPDILHLAATAHERDGRPEVEIWDVHEFLPPDEIVQVYRDSVPAGMDDSIVPFAMDSSGSFFGFPRDVSASRPDDSPVLFFDHEFCEVRPEAESFDDWLSRFLRLQT